jgi:hypothetical protein
MAMPMSVNSMVAQTDGYVLMVAQIEQPRATRSTTGV